MKKTWIKFLSIFGLTTIKVYNDVVKEMSSTILRLSFMNLDKEIRELCVLLKEAEVNDAKKEPPAKTNFTSTATSNVKPKDNPLEEKAPKRQEESKGDERNCCKPKKNSRADSKSPSSL